MSDVRFAVRSLLKSPGFSFVVVLTLALGIGANTAIFSLLDAVMLRPLAVNDPGSLSLLYDDGPATPGDPGGRPTRADIFSWPLIQQFKEALPAGASLAASTPPAQLNARLGNGPATTLVFSQLVSGGFFSTLGIAPVLGRLLTDDDMRTVDGSPVLVVGYQFWQRQLSADPNVLGRVIPINNVPFTIVGVAPENFRGIWSGGTIQVFLPLVMQQAIGYRNNAATHNARDGEAWPPQDRVFWLNAILRSSAEQRASILESLSRLHALSMVSVVDGRTDGESRGLVTRRLALESFSRGFSLLRDQYSLVLMLLMAMVTLLLLIACANVANLLLARWTARQREFAIRLSIGAGRAQLVRQLLLESLLLGVVGGALGLLLADWTSTAIATSALAREILPARIALDGRVLGFCAFVSIATSIAFGVAPAFRGTATSPAKALRSGSVGGAQAVSAMRPLVGAQVALSVVLVLAAVLFGKSLLRLWTMDPGYDRTHLVQVRMNLVAGGLRAEEAPAMYRRIVDTARQIPGVAAAEVARLGIASGARSIGQLTLEGYQPAAGEVVRFMANQVGPTYFSTVGMPIVAGRGFTDRDIAGQPLVAVINETAAYRYFGNPQQALGKRVGQGQATGEIVGVAHDARVLSLREAPEPMAFYPLLQAPRPAQVIEIRTSGDPALVGESVRRAIAAMDARLMADSRPVIVSESLDQGLARDRLITYLATGFGATAMLLACIGLYGVLTYAVSRRTSEMGVRMALGATPGNVIRLVLSDGLRVAVIGVVAGAVIALTLRQAIQGLLYDISAGDPLTYALVIPALMFVAVIASLLPARRAARVDPMTALRTE